MADSPAFPDFKPLELSDRAFLQPLLWAYQPETSELTFTNLFIWQGHYRFAWCREGDWLLITAEGPTGTFWALPPIGPPSRGEVCRRLLTWLKEARGQAAPWLARVDARLAAELAGEADFFVEAQRDQFDYVYRAQDLIQLAGRKYSDKRNHINSFVRSQRYTYEDFREEHLAACLDLACRWCQWHRCEDDMNLMNEWEAVKLALNHYAALELTGGVICIDNRVEAFALGEKLSADTAVVHLEKANPDIRGLYAMINQQFCEQAWGEVAWVNREQDLGEAGLRKAKLSYNPSHLVEKFQVQLT